MNKKIRSRLNVNESFRSDGYVHHPKLDEWSKLKSIELFIICQNVVNIMLVLKI